MSIDLPYLLSYKYFTDAFVLHDESSLFGVTSQLMAGIVKTDYSWKAIKEYRKTALENKPDPRQALNNSWAKFTQIWRFQPLNQIRDYFGESFTLYFAWLGVLIASLWIPALIGTGTFIYGLQKT